MGSGVSMRSDEMRSSKKKLSLRRNRSKEFESFILLPVIYQRKQSEARELLAEACHRIKYNEGSNKLCRNLSSELSTQNLTPIEYTVEIVSDTDEVIASYNTCTHNYY
mmetsp:Transcript_15264/g.13799  ORF Transcript_15264/g.13799 Transcript_15264/m.13799 type:complete len:108 (+) Transcript_15264:115-438(+)